MRVGCSARAHVTAQQLKVVRVCVREKRFLVCFRVYGLEKKQNPKPRKAHHGIFFKKLSRFGIKNNTRTRTEYTSDHRGVF